MANSYCLQSRFACWPVVTPNKFLGLSLSLSPPPLLPFARFIFIARNKRFQKCFQIALVSCFNLRLSKGNDWRGRWRQRGEHFFFPQSCFWERKKEQVSRTAWFAGRKSFERKSATCRLPNTNYDIPSTSVFQSLLSQVFLSLSLPPFLLLSCHPYSYLGISGGGGRNTCAAKVASNYEMNWWAKQN